MYKIQAMDALTTNMGIVNSISASMPNGGLSQVIKIQAMDALTTNMGIVNSISASMPNGGLSQVRYRPWMRSLRIWALLIVLARPCSMGGFLRSVFLRITAKIQAMDALTTNMGIVNSISASMPNGGLSRVCI